MSDCNCNKNTNEDLRKWFGKDGGWKKESVNEQLTFQQFQDKSAELNKKTSELAKVLNSFPKGEMGMVKQTPEVKKIKKEFDTLFKELQNLNKKYVKIYKKELQKVRAEKRRKLQTEESVGEDLRKWFGKGGAGGTTAGGWDRYGTDGQKLGKCGDAKEGDPYAACLSAEKAKKLGKDGIAAFVKRKRAAQKKAGDAKKGGEQKKGQKPVFVKTGASESTITEKNVPTDPAKWSYYKSQAKKKFDVYPSAYANAWAAKKYKAAGGKWKTEEAKLEKEKFTDPDQMRMYDSYYNEELGLEFMASETPFPIEEAEYQGRKVELGKVKRGGSKKFYVYVKDGDKVKKVSFGDTTGLTIKTRNPERRKSFRARHNCDNPGPKTKARYWSCKMWSGPDAVKKMTGENKNNKFIDMKLSNFLNEDTSKLDVLQQLSADLSSLMKSSVGNIKQLDKRDQVEIMKHLSDFKKKLDKISVRVGSTEK